MWWAGPDSDRRPSARQADVLTKLDDRPTTILAMTRFHCSKYLWVLRSGASETACNSQKTKGLESASDPKNSSYLKREGVDESHSKVLPHLATIFYSGSLEACSPCIPQLSFETSWIITWSASGFTPISSNALVMPFISVAFCSLVLPAHISIMTTGVFCHLRMCSFNKLWSLGLSIYSRWFQFGASCLVWVGEYIVTRSLILKAR